VDARDFQRWAVSGYDPTEVPYDMQVAFNGENYRMDRLAETDESDDAGDEMDSEGSEH